MGERKTEKERLKEREVKIDTERRKQRRTEKEMKIGPERGRREERIMIYMVR